MFTVFIVVCKADEVLENADDFQIISIGQPRIDFSPAIAPNGIPVVFNNSQMLITPDNFKFPFTLVDLIFEVEGVNSVTVTLMDGTGFPITSPGLTNPQVVIYRDCFFH